MRVKRILPRGWHPEGKVKGRKRHGANGTKPAEKVGTEEKDVLAVLGAGMDARAPGSPWRLLSCDPTARAEPGKGLHTLARGFRMASEPQFCHFSVYVLGQVSQRFSAAMGFRDLTGLQYGINEINVRITLRTPCLGVSKLSNVSCSTIMIIIIIIVINITGQILLTGLSLPLPFPLPVIENSASTPSCSWGWCEPCHRGSPR